MIEEKLGIINDLVHSHEQWRTACLNFCAAENVASPAVKQFSLTDLSGRYADFLGRDLDNRKYMGTRYIIQLEKLMTELACELFQADYVEFRPLSGHVAGAAVIMGLTKPGEVVMEVGSDGGGHRLGEKLTHAEMAEQLRVHFLPIDGYSYNIDVERARNMIVELRPNLVILGSSNFLFPHPVQAISDILHSVNPDAVLAYDASHVLGLIAGGEFQDPLREGADLMFGSTHKTFPGPQGGLILTNQEGLIRRVSEAAYPGLITNHHVSRSPALAVAMLEMLRFGPEYAQTVIKNAQIFAGELAHQGLDVVGSGAGYTRSHTVLIQSNRWGDNKEIARHLEESNIIVNPVSLPKEQSGSGLRFGVQEITRRGGDHKFMVTAAKIVSDVILGRLSSEKGRQKAEDLANSLTSLRFVFT